MWDQMVLKPDDDSARTGEYVYWGYDFKPALPPAEPTCVAVKLVWLECVGLEVLVVSVACNRDRVTVAISARELRPAGPLAKVLGAICSAIVQIPLLCRLQSWSQAEAGSHRRLYLVLTPIWSTLARLL